MNLIIIEKKTGKEYQKYCNIPEDRVDDCIEMAKIECILHRRPPLMAAHKMLQYVNRFDKKFNIEIENN